MFISQEGMVQRTSVRGIRQTGRAAQGVTLMNIREEDRVSAVALVVESEGTTAAAVSDADLAEGPVELSAGAGEGAACPATAMPAGTARRRRRGRRTSRTTRKLTLADRESDAGDAGRSRRGAEPATGRSARTHRDGRPRAPVVFVRDGFRTHSGTSSRAATFPITRERRWSV